jgi:hypothetical protein
LSQRIDTMNVDQIRSTAPPANVLRLIIIRIHGEYLKNLTNEPLCIFPSKYDM